MAWWVALPTMLTIVLFAAAARSRRRAPITQKEARHLRRNWKAGALPPDPVNRWCVICGYRRMAHHETMDKYGLRYPTRSGLETISDHPFTLPADRTE